MQHNINQTQQCQDKSRRKQKKEKKKEFLNVRFFLIRQFIAKERKPDGKAVHQKRMHYFESSWTEERNQQFFHTTVQLCCRVRMVCGL